MSFSPDIAMLPALAAFGGALAVMAISLALVEWITDRYPMGC